MKIPLTKSFVKTFIEDLNLRNNDIVLENCMLENHDDIELLKIK